MKLKWTVEPKDIELVREVIETHKDKPIVVDRFERNLQSAKPPVKMDEFWLRSVCCLVTSRQPSGEDSRVARFVRKTPFQLELNVCRQAENLRKLAEGTISSAGLRFNERIAGFIVHNLEFLDNGGWEKTKAVLDMLIANQSAEVERDAAEFIDTNFKGFGPKQSRNLLQWLGLTQYEIPLDSRIANWLNKHGFPVQLSAAALGDRNYYNFISDGVQELCRQSGVKPCVLDAAIFISFE
jgi:thermostable 8-oxoguanine DNA glycosylase